MNQTILQIPISKTLKIQADAAARSSGATLEEVLKKLIVKVARHELVIDRPAKKTVKYSPQLYADAKKALENYKKSKTIKFNSAKEAVAYLDKLV